MVYLAGVRHMDIVNGWANPLENTPRLSLVLKGVRRVRPKHETTPLHHADGHGPDSPRYPGLPRRIRVQEEDAMGIMHAGLFSASSGVGNSLKHPSHPMTAASTCP